MNQRWASLAFGITAVGLGLVGADAAGYRLNISASMPYGIWRRGPAPTTLERGLIVLVCLPPNPTAAMAVARGYIGIGRCDDGTEPLLKPLAAVPGNFVSVAANGVSVNGTLIPNSAQKTADLSGRGLSAVPIGDYQVPEGDYWVVASHPGSFDSRYFGALPLSAVVGTAAPVITWR